MNISRPALRFAALHLLAVLPLAASATTLWDESSQGDLSGDRLAPTGLSLSLGSNTLTATTQNGDLEYVTFEVPAGQTITSVYLNSYTGLDGRAFFGLQQGNTFSVPPESAIPADMYGYSHFGPSATGATVGTDFLGQIATGFGAQGFTPPLSAGTYTIWLQQLGTPTTYQLDFVTAAVPEPAATTACVAGALLGVAAIRRRGSVTGGSRHGYRGSSRANP